jgi:peroxiredoxin
MNLLKSTAFLFLTVLITGIIGCSSEEQNMTDSQTDVPESPELVRPLLPGMKAKSFDLQAADGSRVSFDPDNMDRPVVLSFYRGGWCPYCNRQLADFRKIESELKDLGYDLLFVSADRYDVIKESLKIGDVDYTLLSDNDLVTARAYGLAFRVNDEMVEKYREFDIDLEAASGRKHHWLPIPASFVIGKDGVIRFQYANPNYKVRVQGELLLTAARLALNEDA